MIGEKRVKRHTPFSDNLLSANHVVTKSINEEFCTVSIGIAGAIAQGIPLFFLIQLVREASSNRN